jgi:hypothetical protein
MNTILIIHDPTIPWITTLKESNGAVHHYGYNRRRSNICKSLSDLYTPDILLMTTLIILVL